MGNDLNNFIQQDSPDGGFLQSEEWRKFQEAVGRKTYSIIGDDFKASVVEHCLPIVGKYIYIPRGPIMPISNFQFPISNKISNSNDQISKQIQELINLAKKNKAGWIRIEPANVEILEAIRCNTKYSIRKAPHDVQPKEIFLIDITKSEEQILAEMKAKTRYNIKLAEKKGVKIVVSGKQQAVSTSYINEFLRLVNVTACRNRIVCHPENYYRKMIEIIPGDILKLYVAEYQGRVIAANLVIFYGDTCTYLHGASDDEYRNVMAPYMLQWKQITDAKAAGCIRYDFGGISSRNTKHETRNNSWGGITKFKLGFSLNTKSTKFPGSYDIIISPVKYWGYRGIQMVKNIIR